MTNITKRHDNSAHILDKIKIVVNQRIVFTADSTAFHMGQQASRDEIRYLIEGLEARRDPTGI